MGAADQLSQRFIKQLRREGFSPHESERASRILVQAVQPARIEALCRLLVDSGDMTPYAARRMRAALGLSDDERQG